MGFSQADKASVVLSLLGHELAAQLFAQLSGSEQAKIIRSLVVDKRLSDTDVKEICEEFISKFKKTETRISPADLIRGKAFAGIEFPRDSRVEEICDDIPDWILVDHLSAQIESVSAAVLGSLQADRAAKLFREFPAEKQLRVLMNLAKEKVLDAMVLDELEADLEALRVKTSSGRYGQRVGGGARVLALVQALDSETRGQILAEVGAREPSLAQFLEGGLLSVERLSELLPAHLALMLSQMKDSDIGAFLRGEPVAVQNIYLSGLSKRRREDIECLLAPEKKITQKQKTEACERLRQCALQMKGEGKIIFPWEESLVG
ncbi:MAG: FliG C-terminal domain-containing protein [Silvanigrellaceae bacterium]